MIGILITLLVLIALFMLFAWLARRAWSSNRAWVKWLGTALAGLLTLVFVLVTVIGAIGVYKIYAPRNVATPALTVQATREQIARGEHLATVACVSCHSANGELPMSGGNNLSADTGLPLGDLYAPNVTPGSAIKDWSDADLFRVIRTGVRIDGRATVMAGLGTRYLSDEDTLAVIAYLRNSPSAQKETPPFNPTFLLALFTGAGLVPLDIPATVGAISAPPKAANAGYGKYVLDYAGCADCHGPKLDGNVPPPNPPAPSLKGLIPNVSKDNFLILVRSRGAVTGSQANTTMPWRSTSKLDDVELEALFSYMRGVTSP